MKTSIILVLLTSVLVLATSCGGSPGTSAVTTSAKTTSTPTPTIITTQATTSLSAPQSNLMFRQGASGTLTAISGNTLTVNNSQETVTVNINSDTVIQKNTYGAVADLKQDDFLTVIGEKDDSGNIIATSIVVRSWSQNLSFTPPSDESPDSGSMRPGGTRPSASPPDSSGTLPSGTPPAGGTAPTSSGGQNPPEFNALPNGIMGTLASVDGNTLTIKTSDGEKTVKADAGTTIQITVPGTVGDLQQGQSVNVMGSRDTNDILSAVSITIMLTGQDTVPVP
jgi:hypothetical protein